jgi:hypothetical protein
MRGRFDVVVLAAALAGVVSLVACQHAAPQGRSGRSEDLGDMLQSSCDGGSGLACETLARALELGDGRGEQVARVAALRRRACELGYQLSCPPKPAP